MLARSLSYLLLVTTFLLVLLGGVVHTQGASLACPDWPLCYGLVFPPMEGGILLEHGHRLLASAVGLMSVILAIAVYPLAGAARRWALGGVALVLAQGLLGGLTVIFRLPPPISIAHLGTSMLFLAWSVRMCWLLQPMRVGGAAHSPVLGQLRARVLFGAVAVYLQLILGAAVRHTHASLSCGLEAFGCSGSWLPETGPQWLQTSHRVSALFVVAAVVIATVPVLKLARSAHDGYLRALALTPHILVLLQIVMGVLTIRTGVQVHVVVTHLALGALLWANMVLLVLQTSPYAAVRATRNP
jgi:heme A synthase